MAFYKVYLDDDKKAEAKILSYLYILEAKTKLDAIANCSKIWKCPMVYTHATRMSPEEYFVSLLYNEPQISIKKCKELVKEYEKSRTTKWTKCKLLMDWYQITKDLDEFNSEND